MDKLTRLDAEDALSLSDRVYQCLRRDILACVLAPGEAISEGRLAARYAVGKAPIRAALSRLRQDGLVSASPRRSFVVSPLTLRDIEELYELRLVLESAAARLAAGKANMARLAELDDICRQDYIPGDVTSTLRFLDANRAFHLEVAEASGNRRFVRLLAQILDETSRVMFVGLGLRNRNEEMHHEHQALMLALASGDAEQAAHLAQAQVVASRAMVISAITSSEAWLGRPIG